MLPVFDSRRHIETANKYWQQNREAKYAEDRPLLGG
jgi:hypothetical protein